MELVRSTITAIPFKLYLASDHTSPATGKTFAPGSLVLWKAGANGVTFVSPSGTISEIGNGWYELTTAVDDLSANGPLILHATATGCDPVNDLHWVGPEPIVVGSTNPIPFFLAQSADHVTGLTGATPTLLLGKAGGALAAAAGAVSELSFGWYILTPTSVDTGLLGALVLYGTAASADSADDLYTVEAAVTIARTVYVETPSAPINDVTDILICNLALGHCGNADGIASLTERTTAARACNQFYQRARDEVIEDFPWPAEQATAALTLVQADPTSEWGFSYRYPAEAVTIRKLLSGTRIDTRASRVVYDLGKDAQGPLIFTDLEGAIAEYTVRVTDVTRWPPSRVRALALLLAAYIAPQVTGGDPTKLRERNFGLYQRTIATAQAKSANEVTDDVAPESDTISARA